MLVSVWVTVTLAVPLTLPLAALTVYGPPGVLPAVKKAAATDRSAPAHRPRKGRLRYHEVVKLISGRRRKLLCPIDRNTGRWRGYADAGQRRGGRDRHTGRAAHTAARCRNRVRATCRAGRSKKSAAADVPSPLTVHVKAGLRYQSVAKLIFGRRRKLLCPIYRNTGR